MDENVKPRFDLVKVRPIYHKYTKEVIAVPMENAKNTVDAIAYGLDIQLQPQSQPGPDKAPTPGIFPIIKNIILTA